jgi:hypothetical protein
MFVPKRNIRAPLVRGRLVKKIEYIYEIEEPVLESEIELKPRTTISNIISFIFMIISFHIVLSIYNFIQNLSNNEMLFIQFCMIIISFLYLHGNMVLLWRSL